MIAVCPGCGGEAHTTMVIEAQPVVLNYRCSDPALARSVPRGDLDLVQCRRCGLVSNALFKAELMPYDAGYENSQAHSPTFRRYLDALIDTLMSRHAIRGARVLEIGCGKGAFLETLVARGDNRGDGYDTTWEDDGRPRDPRLRFVRGRLTAAGVAERYGAIVCRHVVEHVPDVRGFLDELASIAQAAGDPIVMLETPALEWICAHDCFWDFFYEHCSYFPRPTLAWLCAQAGFSILAHDEGFDGQYQVIWLRRARPAPRAGAPPATVVDLAAAATAMDRRRRDLERKLTGVADWGIWGAGAKGVTLAHRMGSPPRCLIDTNPAKQGGYIPGLGIPIVSPRAPVVDALGVIVIVNPSYASEITAELHARSVRGRVLTL
jgi:SAM-dependent methyltransferase